MPSSIKRSTVAAAGIGLAAVVAGGLAVAPTGSANAAARDGVCDSGEFCYSYNSGFSGSVSDFTGSISDLGSTQPSCYEFKSAGNGQGLCTKNNAASVWNRTSGPVTVYYNSGYGGSSQTIAVGAKVDLNATLKNNNAAHKFGGGGVTGATAVARARTWVTAGVPYNSGARYNGYRQDCSGYVSMAWGLASPGLTTDQMPRIGGYIGKSSLRQGDALLNASSGSSGHVVLFDAWADSTHTSYWGYEETPSRGAVYRKIPYPYWSGYGTFAPFRYSGLS